MRSIRQGHGGVTVVALVKLLLHRAPELLVVAYAIWMRPVLLNYFSL